MNTMSTQGPSLSWLERTDEGGRASRERDPVRSSAHQASFDRAGNPIRSDWAANAALWTPSEPMAGATGRHASVTPYATPGAASGSMAQLQRSAKDKLNNAGQALGTAVSHLTASADGLRAGRYLRGMHYLVSAMGNLTGAGHNTLGGLADLAQAHGHGDIAKELRQYASHLSLGAGPLGGFGRALRDVDTALTTLADPGKNAYEKQRDLNFALGSVLNAVGVSSRAWQQVSGSSNELIKQVNTALANSGNILRGVENIQRNAQGLRDALGSGSFRDIASYGSGTLYGLGETASGLGRALAQALKASGSGPGKEAFVQAGEALEELSSKAQSIGIMASNAQILINSLWRA